jgi:NitT/TauT family transport system ATP-binding protein
VTYLDIRHVSKEFPSQTTPWQAVADVSLSIPQGSFVSIVGPSGCGKSTLLKIVAGILASTGGEVTFQEKRVQSPPFDVIYLFQQYSKSIFPWLTVLENAAFGVRNRAHHADATAIREQCLRMLDRVGLGPFASYYPWQLSGGMQQRVAIARALCCRPAVLLMDEPFSAVDALTRSGLQELILELWTELGLTVLLVTHDIEEAVYLSQRVIVLSRAPAVVDQTVEIAIPYPRDPIRTKERPDYLDYRRVLLERILRPELESVLGDKAGASTPERHPGMVQ